MPHVLVIEDDKLLRRVLVSGLSEHGHRVSAATGWDSGVALVEDGDVDLAIADTEVLDASGTIALAGIRRRFPRLPVIALTDGMLEFCPSSDATTVIVDVRTLVKPFALEALMQAVSEELSGLRGPARS